MNIRLTRNTIAGGRPVSAGQTIEVDDRDGNLLVEMGKAVPVKSSPAMETAMTGTPENTSLTPGQTKTEPPETGDSNDKSPDDTKTKK